MTVTYCTAEAGHAASLAPRLRAMDLRELLAVTKGEPEVLLARDIACSDLAWAAMVDGECHALFGVCPFQPQPGVGVPWFLGTDEVIRFRREWLQAAPLFIKAMHRLYPTLTNAVHQDNASSIRWLKRLGFQVLNESLFIGDEPFLIFTRIQQCVTPQLSLPLK